MDQTFRRKIRFFQGFHWKQTDSLPFHQSLTLDNALRDIVRNCVGNRPYFGRFCDHNSSKSRIANETVGTPVACHHHMRCGVYPQSGLPPFGDSKIPLKIINWHILKDRTKIVGKDFYPREIGLLCVHGDIAPIRRTSLRAANCVGKFEPVVVSLLPHEMFQRTVHKGLVRSILLLSLRPRHH